MFSWIGLEVLGIVSEEYDETARRQSFSLAEYGTSWRRD